MAAAPRPRRCAPGPARGAPFPRRNHGFAPRLQSGADAEAILSEAPVRAAEHSGGCTRLLSRAGPRARRPLGRDRYQPLRPPRLPQAGPGLVATPPPRPPRIRLRSDTRSPCPTPGHVSRFSGGPLFRPNKGASGRRGARPAPDRRARPEGQGRRRRSQSGFCAAPPGLLRWPKPPPPVAQARPHCPCRPRLGRDKETGASGSQPPTRSPVDPSVRVRQPAHRPATGPWPGTLPPGTHRNCVPGRWGADAGFRTKATVGIGGAGCGAPAPEAAVRRILTGICLLIEDCGLIIQPVPRRRRHRRRRWRRLQGRG